MRRIFILLACAPMPLGAQTLSANSGNIKAASGGQGGLADIIVTAQRRSESLKDVPLSISVQNGEALERQGIASVRDLTLVTPGLKIDRLGVYTQPAIRGISSQQADPGNDPNVAIYVDGVYQPNQAANSFDFADLDRIEVAKGPQGTLFGRNATGGAIQLFTRRPEFVLTGNATIGYGNYDDFLIKGFVTGPLVGDTLAASISVFHESNEGYNRDIIGNHHTSRLNSTLVRGKLLWKPVDWAEFTLAGQYMRRKDGGAAAGQPLDGNTIAVAIDPAAILPKRPREVASDIVPDLDVESRSVSLTGKFDLANGTLTSITSYSDTDVHILLDADYSAVPIITYDINQPDTNFTQELTFASDKDGPFSWVAGLFFYKDKASWSPLQIGSYNGFGTQRTTAYAVFGELNYDVTDRLTVIGGLRYSHERKQLNGAVQIGSAVPAPQLPRIGSHNWNSATPRLSLRYSINDATNVYATYSQGFKSGGFVVGSLDPAPFSPEKVRAYEIGLKTKSGALAFNAAGFYYDYGDMQVNTSARVNGVDVGITTNAARSRIYGVDLEATARVTNEFTLTAGLSAIHAAYEDYRNAIVQRPSGVGGNVQTTIDASGNDLIRAPAFTGTVTGTYRRDFGFGRVEFTASGYYSSKFYFDSDNRITQPGYANVNARLAWSPSGTPLTLAVWGKNLTDEDVIQSTFILATADGVSYAPPRTFGATMGLAF